MLDAQSNHLVAGGAAFCAVILLQFIVAAVGTAQADKLELRRKVQHATSGLLIWYLFAFVCGRDLSYQTLFFSCLVGLGIQLAREKYSAVNDFILKQLGPILRAHERKSSLPGAFWVLLGCGISILCWSRSIASMAILYLALGDPTASLVGQLFGRHTLRFSNGKSLAGFVGMAAVCCAVTAALVAGADLSGSGLALWLLLGGLVPALVESVPMPRWLNDNLCIPVLSAAVLGACQSVGVLPALE